MKTWPGTLQWSPFIVLLKDVPLLLYMTIGRFEAPSLTLKASHTLIQYVVVHNKFYHCDISIP